MWYLGWGCGILDGGVVPRMGVWYLGWMCGNLTGGVVSGVRCKVPWMGVWYLRIRCGPCGLGVVPWMGGVVSGVRGNLVPEAGAVASSSADQRATRDRAPRPQGRDYRPAAGEGRVQAGCCCPGDSYPPERAVHRLRCCRQRRFPSNEQKKTSKKKRQNANSVSGG